MKLTNWTLAGALALSTPMLGCIMRETQERTVVDQPQTDRVRYYDSGAGDRREYYYYPDSEVYYDIHDDRYSWRDEHGWHQDRRPPGDHRLGDRVRIDMRGDRPDSYHDRVIHDYPHPNGHHDDRDHPGDRNDHDRDRGDNGDRHNPPGHDNDRQPGGNDHGPANTSPGHAERPSAQPDGTANGRPGGARDDR